MAMKILLTNHHLVNYGGTEIFTFELARSLKLLGHEVYIYTRFLGKLEQDLNKICVPVTTDLTDYKNIIFDIAHTHHSITALDVRNHFPKLPIFFLSHGYQHFLEKPPFIDINISQYGAVSERVKNYLGTFGIEQSKIHLIYNLVNENLFYPISVINSVPKKALVISTKLSEEIRSNIFDACSKLNIKVTYVGGEFGEVSNFDLPQLINQSDIVFTLGRGVMETMMCGRVPIILDKPGFDGMVTPENADLLLVANYSGKIKQIYASVNNIMKEVLKYSSKNGERLRYYSLLRFSSKIIPRQLLKIYEKTINRHDKKKRVNLELVKFVINSIDANNFFGYNSIFPLHSKIVRSRFYKIWRLMQKLKSFK